jgi:hypothetical protein
MYDRSLLKLTDGLQEEFENEEKKCSAIGISHLLHTRNEQHIVWLQAG